MGRHGPGRARHRVHHSRRQRRSALGEGNLSRHAAGWFRNRLCRSGLAGQSPLAGHGHADTGSLRVVSAGQRAQPALRRLGHHAAGHAHRRLSANTQRDHSRACGAAHRRVGALQPDAGRNQCHARGRDSPAHRLRGRAAREHHAAASHPAQRRLRHHAHRQYRRGARVQPGRGTDARLQRRRRHRQTHTDGIHRRGRLAPNGNGVGRTGLCRTACRGAQPRRLRPARTRSVP